MKIEILKRNYLKRNIIIGIVAVLFIGKCTLTFTKAKYRTTESIPLVNGTINYTPYDLKMVAMYQEENGDYESIDIVPTSGYSLNEKKSYCKVNGEKDESMKLSYDTTTRGLSVTPMTAKGTKCYLYFDEQILAKDIILANSKINEETPDFNGVATTDEGLYKTQDDRGYSYYFRGAVTNNWVKFAGYYWRIVRINGDGSIRVIYNGISTETTGDSTMINSSQAFNSSRDRSEYVGYMYTEGEQHGNTTNSPIKDILDTWYTTNIANKEYETQISKEAEFCGDRELTSGYSWNIQTQHIIIQDMKD